MHDSLNGWFSFIEQKTTSEEEHRTCSSFFHTTNFPGVSGASCEGLQVSIKLQHIYENLWQTYIEKRNNKRCTSPFVKHLRKS